MVALVEPTITQSPADRLAARLDDPATAEALNELLDHVDLLAVLVTGLSEFFARGDTMTDTIRDALREFKAAAPRSSAGIDIAALKDLVEKGSALAPKLVAKLPVVEQALEPGPNGVDIVDVGVMVSRAAVQGTGAAEVGGFRGFFGLLKALRDDDVHRAANFVLSVSKALGGELHATQSAGPRRRPTLHR